MKVRLSDNRVSLRLSEDDVAALECGESVILGLSLGRSGQMRFELCTAPGIEDLQISMDNSAISVLIPESWVIDWPGDERIGFESAVLNDDGSELHVDIEKDLRWFRNKSTAD